MLHGGLLGTLRCQWLVAAPRDREFPLIVNQKCDWSITIRWPVTCRVLSILFRVFSSLLKFSPCSKFDVFRQSGLTRDSGRAFIDVAQPCSGPSLLYSGISPSLWNSLRILICGIWDALRVFSPFPACRSASTRLGTPFI